MPKSKRGVRAESSVLRPQLARLVQRRIDAAGITRELAASLVDDAASEISRLMNDRLEGFSTDRLIRILTRLGADVDIVVRQRNVLGPRGKARVITGPAAKSAGRRAR